MNTAWQRRVANLRVALDWRLRRWLGDTLVDLPVVSAARLWRHCLRATTFIAITGSAGKTSTKELLVGMLAHKAATIGNPGTMNVLAELARLLVRTRPRHAFAVCEIGAPYPGSLDAPLALFRPSIGILTVIGDDHHTAYQSRENIAKEKGKLVTRLGASGVAVLNADDPLIAALAPACQARVLTFGRSTQADVQALEVAADWPGRLRLTVRYRNDVCEIQTQLCGEQLATAVLAAVAGGIAAGLSLQECAQAARALPPFEGRMEPVATPDGIHFVCDDYKAPWWSLPASLEFMRRAQARRKVIVIGTLSDLGTGSPASDKYIKAAREAMGIADLTVFVGTWATHVLRARTDAAAQGTLQVFNEVREAAEFLGANLQAGDLVLLKGNNKRDHLRRIIWSRERTWPCWRSDCQQDWYCNQCPDQDKPSGRPVYVPLQALAPLTGANNAIHPPNCAMPAQWVLGLGNPAAQFAGTPHNIGHQVVDHLAKHLAIAWKEVANASIATTEDGSLGLIKLHADMNHAGPALKQLSMVIPVALAASILVHDELELPLGQVKTRVNGGAAGHRGIASVIEAFQSDEFRRVKVGVRQPALAANKANYVLAPFAPEAMPQVEASVASAAKRVLELATTPAPKHRPPKPRAAKPATPAEATRPAPRGAI